MGRTTRKDMETLVKDIESDAKELGLLQPYEELVWSPGNVTNGYAPEVSVYIRQETGMNRDWNAGDFLPKFTHKDTATMAHAKLSATLRVLEAMVRKA